MTDQLTTGSRAGRPSGPAARLVPARCLLAAGLLSGTAAVSTAAVTLTGPTQTAAGPPNMMLAVLLPAGAVAAVAILTGLLGALTALVGVTRPRRLFVARVVAAVGVVEAFVFGIALQGMQALALVGYLVAFALPIGLGVIIVGTIRRYRRLRWPVLVGVAIAVVGGVTAGMINGDVLARLMVDLAGGFRRAGAGLLITAVYMAAAVTWAATAAAIIGSSARGRRLTAAVTRHRRPLTILAALGPLPYAVVRMTWLTPWPLLAPSADDLTAGTRLWGLLLGGGAVLGVVLTIGLIRPWSERFPRWMPGLAGRPVPIAAAALPGGLVAAVVTAAAVPMLMLLTISPTAEGPGEMSLLDRLLAVAVFPCWFWGPLLGLAVWGYVGHRLAEQRAHDHVPPVPAADRPALR